MDLAAISLVVRLIGFSKLPVFGLHMWLPKVHVEASILGSMVLAGVVLKAGSIFCNIFCVEQVILVMGVVIAAMMMIISDGKVVIAYSSVIHISCRVIMFGLLVIYGGYSHIVVSPLMFVMVYVGYLMNGSRAMGESFSSVLLRRVLLFNIGFPLVGAFYCEVLWFSKLGVMVMCFLAGYVLMGIVSVRIFYKGKRSNWVPWMVFLPMIL